MEVRVTRGVEVKVEVKVGEAVFTVVGEFIKEVMEAMEEGVRTEGKWTIKGCSQSIVVLGFDQGELGEER